MYCMHCGKEIDENLLVCPCCGTAQNQVTKKDYGGIGWGILGYFVPMAGIILFFIHFTDRDTGYFCPYVNDAIERM